MQFYSAPLCYITTCDKCAGPPRLMESWASLIRRTSSSWQLPYFHSFLCNIVSKVTWLRTPQRSPPAAEYYFCAPGRWVEGDPTWREKPAERCYGTAACRGLMMETYHMVQKPNRDPDSLPAPASPDTFRTSSQGQLLGMAAWRLGYFAAFCFFDWQMWTVWLRSSGGESYREANKITSISVNIHTHTRVWLRSPESKRAQTALIWSFCWNATETIAFNGSHGTFY